MEKIIEMKNNTPVSSPLFPTDTEAVTVTKIGGTNYEVYTHFSEDGTETVLRQFMDLLREANIL